MLRRVDAENRLQTLKEELDFQKNIYSEVGPAGPAFGAGRSVCAGLVPVGERGGSWHPAPRSQWGGLGAGGLGHLGPSLRAYF